MITDEGARQALPGILNGSTNQVALKQVADDFSLECGKSTSSSQTDLKTT
jgi:hypothetical protein